MKRVYKGRRQPSGWYWVVSYEGAPVETSPSYEVAKAVYDALGRHGLRCAQLSRRYMRAGEVARVEMDF